jgi:hypothetical protein
MPSCRCRRPPAGESPRPLQLAPPRLQGFRPVTDSVASPGRLRPAEARIPLLRFRSFRVFSAHLGSAFTAPLLMTLPPSPRSGSGAGSSACRSVLRHRAAGREARTGGSSRDRGPGWTPIDTLEVSARVTRRTCREGHERRGREGVTEVSGGEPEGARSLGGDRASSGVNRSVGRADRRPDQGPGGEGRGAGVVRGNEDVRRRGRTTGGHGAPTRRAGWSAGTSPWKANPGRGCGMKQAREVVEGGNRRGCAKHRGRNEGRSGKPPVCGPPRRMPRLGARPHGRRTSHPCEGQVEAVGTLKRRRSSGEDEPVSREPGDDAGRGATGARGKPRRRRGRGQPDRSAGPAFTTLCRAANLRRGFSRSW